MSNKSEKDLDINVDDIPVLDLDSDDNTEKAAAETDAASSIEESSENNVETTPEETPIDENTTEESASEEVTAEETTKAESEPATDTIEEKDENNASDINSDGIEIISAETVPDDYENNVLEPDNRKFHFTTGDIIRYIILAIAIGVFIFAASKLIPRLISYKKEAENNKQIEDEVVSKKDEPASLPSNDEYPNINPSIEVDFNRLFEINNDSVGWVEVPSIGVSYAVVQGPDNEYYLQHDINNNFAWSGAIYLDYRCERDLSDTHASIYGHHMNDGTMFTNLLKYDSEDFFKKNQENYNNYIYMYLKDYINVYQIFAVVDAEYEEDPDSFVVRMFTDAQKHKYLNHIKEKQLYDTGISVSIDDQLLTLFTCQADSSSKVRHLVHSKLIKQIKK